MRSPSLPVSIGSVLVSLLLLLLALPVATAAQDGTPASTPFPLGAAECTVDPIDPARYGTAVLAATPQASLPDTATGQPADADTVTAVTDTIEQSIACTNAGEIARLLAVIDPSYAPTLLNVPADQFQGALDAIANATPEPGAAATPLIDDQGQDTISSTLIGIREVIVFPDGQVMATVELDSAQLGPGTTQIYLRMLGTRYVVTTYVFLAPADATPAA